MYVISIRIITNEYILVTPAGFDRETASEVLVRWCEVFSLFKDVHSLV